MSYAIARIDIDDTGFDQAVEITFNVSGKTLAATYYEPAEAAEIDLIEVTYAGGCIIDQLTDEHIKTIENACWESLEEEEI